MGCCLHRCADQRLIAASNKAAQQMNLGTNAEVFAHPLNRFSNDVKDPRSLTQRREDPALSDEKIQRLITPDNIVNNQKQGEIGFAPASPSGAGRGSELLQRAHSRNAFDLNKQPAMTWSNVEIVIALGHNRLTALPDDSVSMTIKSLGAAPPESRWLFVPVEAEDLNQSLGSDHANPQASLIGAASVDVELDQAAAGYKFWHIVSVAFPDKVLTCPVEVKGPAKLTPLQMGAQNQIFRYTDEGNLLPGTTDKAQMALWVDGYNHQNPQQTLNVVAMPRFLPSTKTKTVNYTNKKGKAAVKQKTVNISVDVVRKLRWSVMPEEHHLVILPRLLRTTHAHSPFFRVVGEEVRQMELQKGSEVRVHLAGTKLIAYSPLLPYIIGAAEGDWKKDKFWALCQLLGCPLVDRTGTLDCPLKMKALHPIPAMGADPGSLPDLMRNRARQLLDLYVGNGKQLQVLWSGGIDTTAVVCSFLQVASAEEKSHLLIRYCARSVTEYPEFHDKFISQLPSRRIEGHVRDAFLEGPTVTGDPADMLMGTLVMAGAFKGRYLANGKPNALHFALDKPWSIVIPTWLHGRGLLGGTNLDDSKREWLAWMHPFVQASPVPIITVFDWLWWVTYACKYQHDLLRVFYNRSQVPEQLRTDVINFFQSEEFDRWSFHHHNEKMPDRRVWASYKMPLKNFIFEHTGDRNYRAYKMKVQSVRNSWGFELGITDLWEVISFGRFSVSLRRLSEKYGTDLDRFLTQKTITTRSARTAPGSEYIAAHDSKCASAVAADNGYISLAAFHGAEVYDPTAARAHNTDGGGGDGFACGDGGE